MRLAQVRIGRWYETKRGTGQATFIGTVTKKGVGAVFNITNPKRGLTFVRPPEIVREVAAPAEE